MEDEAPKKRRLRLTPQQVERRVQLSFYGSLLAISFAMLGVACTVQFQWLNRYQATVPLELAFDSIRGLDLEMRLEFSDSGEEGAGMPEQARKMPPGDRILPELNVERTIVRANVPGVPLSLPASPGGAVLPISVVVLRNTEPGNYAGIFQIREVRSGAEFLYPLNLTVRDPWALVKRIGLVIGIVFAVAHALFLWMNPLPHGELKVWDFEGRRDWSPRAGTCVISKPSLLLRWLFPWTRSFVKLPELVSECPSGSVLEFRRPSIFTARKRKMVVEVKVHVPEDGEMIHTRISDAAAFPDGDTPDAPSLETGANESRDRIAPGIREGGFVCVSQSNSQTLTSGRFVCFQFRRHDVFSS